MHDAAVSLKKETLREAGLGMLAWDKDSGATGLRESVTGSDTITCGFGWVGILTRR